MNNSWKDAYNASYREGFERGKREGFLIGGAEIVVSLVKESSESEEVRRALQTLYPQEYVEEVKAIIAKYPHYSREHLARRVIFEATYLP